MSDIHRKTALVVGAGFIGAASAWQLQRSGWQVTLIDLGDERRAASWGNAGHLATEQTQPLASWANLRTLPQRLFSFGGPVGMPWSGVAAWLPFGLRLMRHANARQLERGTQALSGLLAPSLPAWQRLLAQTGGAQGMDASGHYVAWESAGAAQKGRTQWLAAHLGTARVTDASADELAFLKARFQNRPVAALRFHNTGQLLDIAATRAQLHRAFMQAGGQRLDAQVARLSIQDGKAFVHTASAQTLSADQVIVAAGVGSAQLLKPLGLKVPLIAERGYHVETSHAPSSSHSGGCLPVAFEDRSVIITHFKQTVRIAGFTEFTQHNAAPDARKWQALRRHGKELGLSLGVSPSSGSNSASSNPLSNSSQEWLGCRPTLPDYLPAIGRSAVAGNLIYAFGHQHLGVTLAAITGELVADVAAGDSPAVNLSPFNLQRFQ